MKALVVGLGIGQVYVSELEQRDWEIVTVDANPEKNANYANLEDALSDHTIFDLSIIAVPNFLHYEYAGKVAVFSKVVLVEKPGFRTKQEFIDLTKMFPSTKFVIAKNNKYRTDLLKLFHMVRASADIITTVEILWSSKNRIPSPGSWFTNKEKAWGGVSRDLMPHLINEAQLLNSYFPEERTEVCDYLAKYQNHTLDSARNDFDNQYGVCDWSEQAVYDVDDQAILEYYIGHVLVRCEANWKTDDEDFIGIRVHSCGDKIAELKLGLCPNECYGKMIDDIMQGDPLTGSIHQADDLEMIAILEEFDRI